MLKQICGSVEEIREQHQPSENLKAALGRLPPAEPGRGDVGRLPARNGRLDNRNESPLEASHGQRAAHQRMCSALTGGTTQLCICCS